MQQKGVLFDLDGTLLDSVGVWDGIGAAYLQARGLIAPQNLDRRLCAMTTEQVAAYFRTLGARDSVEAIAHALREAPLAAYRQTVPARPGARALLQALAARGIPMGIVSSTNARCIRPALERLGLSGYFSFLLCADDFGSGKDRPDIFLEGAKRLGTAPAETLVFEDSLYAMRTAKKAGFSVAAVEESHAAPDRSQIAQAADLVLHELSDFPLSFLKTGPQSCCAVIVAAGASRRMGFSKIEASIGGLPVLVRTLMAFQKTRGITRMVVVCPPEKTAYFRAWLSGWGFGGQVAAVVPGGETRQQSVAAGVRAAGDADWLAIHDGARCLVTPWEIARVLTDARRYGAAALAVPVKDTVKLADHTGMVETTPPRERLWAVQTPQVFPREQFVALLPTARPADTDDCQLFERAGLPVHLCPGSYENLKLTTPDDLLSAQEILRKRKEQEDANRTRV